MPSEPSIIQHLLTELSFEGANVKQYRRGGLGLENVLTAEVWQGLDFLPREQFLGAVVRAFNGKNIEAARALLLTQIEEVSFTFLPGPAQFRPDAPQRDKAAVHPDGVLETSKVYAYIEAKRIQPSSFQPEQLAREFVVVTREAEARGRRPLLLLLLGHAPPVSVAGAGRQEIDEAIRGTLAAVLLHIISPYSEAELSLIIDESVAWITWQTISEIVQTELSIFKANMAESASVCNAVQRVANSVIDAIASHA